MCNNNARLHENLLNQSLVIGSVKTKKNPSVKKIDFINYKVIDPISCRSVSVL